MIEALWANEGVPGRAGSSSRNALSRTRRALPLWARVVLFVLLALTATACGRVQAPDPTTQDSYKVTFATEPASPRVGDGVIVLTLATPGGEAVNNAQVELEANMSHAGMVPVRARGSGGQAGTYRIPLRWTMAGDWYVDVRFTLPDGALIGRRFGVTVK